MNKNFLAGLFVGLALLAIFAFKPAAEKPVAVQKWEYLQVKGVGNWEAKMNENGQKGWELVTYSDQGVAIFKRPAE